MNIDTLANKLIYTHRAVNAIQDAIERCGYDLTDVPLSRYHEYITKILEDNKRPPGDTIITVGGSSIESDNVYYLVRFVNIPYPKDNVESINYYDHNLVQENIMNGWEIETENIQNISRFINIPKENNNIKEYASLEDIP